MTTSPTVVIQPPLLVRIYVAGFMAFWVAAVIWTTVIHHHGPSIAIGVAFIALGGALAYRLFRLGVRSGPDDALIVRYNLGSRRLTRDQVQEFRVSNNGGMRLGQRGVQALLRDGTIYSLDVCRTPFRPGTKRLTGQPDQLQTWLRSEPGAPLPPPS